MERTEPEPEPGPEPGPALTVVVVSASERVASAVATACPPEVDLHRLASVGELASVGSLHLAVVVLDPAEVAPGAVVEALGWRPVLVSVSDLELADDEVGVDVRLPLRRLDRSGVRQALRLLELCRVEDPS